ncbi:MAG: NFACT family protein, partial [Bacteroidota bacterium]|nr:NFACT family protein [Bacteroidota bacterium]MDX5429570.1 NFACT family protein [Bacteroidota bacterium]MDX5468357.1 NFACT family protein [Bacteroidota bacterium]
MEALHTFQLHRLGRELQSILREAILHDAFSIEKDQLYLHWKCADGSWYNQEFRRVGAWSVLSSESEIPRNHKRRRSQLKELIGQKVLKLRAPLGERTLQIQFPDASLYFQFHGLAADVLLEEKDLISWSLRGQEEGHLEEMKDLSGTLTHWEQVRQAPFYRGVLKQELSYFEENGHHLEEVLDKMNTGKVYLIQKNNGDYGLRYTQQDKVIGSYSLLLHAIHDWSKLVLGRYYFERSKTSLIQARKAEMQHIEKRLMRLKEELQAIQNQNNYRHLGDLILSQIHLIPSQADTVQLTDYATGKQIEVSLSAKLNAQENAQRYYRKAKNQGIQERQIQEELIKLQAKHALLQSEITALEVAEESRDLRAFQKGEKKKTQEQTRLPYHEFEMNGF